MKVLLLTFVFYMNPDTRKVELMWQETVPQESMEVCKATGEQYKYLIEISPNIEVRYQCVGN